MQCLKFMCECGIQLSMSYERKLKSQIRTDFRKFKEDNALFM